MKILICDDHAIFRAGLRAALAVLDAELIESASSDEALRLVAEDEEIDLVLLDLTMPGTDGLTALRKLRAEHPAIPVVIVSASEEPQNVRAALDAGSSGFIPKSSSAELLRSALQVVLSGGIYVPPEALPSAGSPSPRSRTKRELRRERVAGLTARQLDVVRLMARGLTNREIGGVLGIAEGTVKAHIGAALEALDVSNRTEAALVLRELDPEG